MFCPPLFLGISKKEISQSISMQEYAAAGAGAGYRFFQGIWEQNQVFPFVFPRQNSKKGSRIMTFCPFFFGISKKEISPYPCKCPDIHLR